MDGSRPGDSGFDAAVFEAYGFISEEPPVRQLTLMPELTE